MHASPAARSRSPWRARRRLDGEPVEQISPAPRRPVPEIGRERVPPCPDHRSASLTRRYPADQDRHRGSVATAGSRCQTSALARRAQLPDQAHDAARRNAVVGTRHHGQAEHVVRSCSVCGTESIRSFEVMISINSWNPLPSRWQIRPTTYRCFWRSKAVDRRGPVAVPPQVLGHPGREPALPIPKDQSPSPTADARSTISHIGQFPRLPDQTVPISEEHASSLLSTHISRAILIEAPVQRAARRNV
jgi:hypothetical protein